jgi:hypothetical protein
VEGSYAQDTQQSDPITDRIFLNHCYMELVNPALWPSSDSKISEDFAYTQFANPEPNFSCESRTKLVDTEIFTDSLIGHVRQVWLLPVAV